MIPELGHFALILALCLAAVQAATPVVAPALGIENGAGGDAHGRAGAVPVFACRVRLPDAVVCGARLFGRVCRAQLQLATAAAVSRLRRLGRARGVAAVVGFDAVRMGRGGDFFQPQHSRRRRRESRRRDGIYRSRVFVVYDSDIQPVCANDSAGGGRSRFESVVARPGARDSSADALHGLCRFRRRVFVRGGRAVAGAVGRGVGAVDAALDEWRVGVFDLRHRAGKLVGVLRVGLGRMVVLGSGGKRFADAVARGDGADSFAGGDRKAGVV